MFITYTPAFDVYHGIFRSLLILEIVGSSRVEVDKLKILDFYLSFPRAVEYITRTRGISSAAVKKVLDAEPPSHAKIPSPRMLYRQTEAISEMALRSLVAQGFLDREEFLDGWGSRTSKVIPESLMLEMNRHVSKHSELCRFIVERLSVVPLYGPRGLKAVTNLIEYRYDNH